MFPGTVHVSQVRLDRALDEEVWSYARASGFAIVTKDADFGDLSVLHGVPPQIVWLRLGNCTVRQVELLLRANQQAILTLGNSPDVGILTLY
jgi:predicted nuclease of predicted toxin-antitoxin system